MCVIAYKPLNVAFPEEKILSNCFENNDDGAGFMYAFEGKVHIRKGYETFKAFMGALNRARAKTGDDVPYVMHFRIATQGYENTMTHPFPLSSKMDNLKLLRSSCNIGVAHNGIIDLTSDGSKTYSDTMKFITDYLSLIIQGFDWSKNERTCQLIENLISGSRLAILDKDGHCKLLGKGWEEDKGVFYSNHSWAREPYKWPATNYYGASRWWEYDDYIYRGWSNNDKKATEKSSPKAEVKATVHSSGTTTPKKKSTKTKAKSKVKHDWTAKFDRVIGDYMFEEHNCPQSVENDSSYCPYCTKYGACKYSNTYDKRVELAKKAASM